MLKEYSSNPFILLPVVFFVDQLDKPEINIVFNTVLRIQDNPNDYFYIRDAKTGNVLKRASLQGVDSFNRDVEISVRPKISVTYSNHELKIFEAGFGDGLVNVNLPDLASFVSDHITLHGSEKKLALI